MLTVSNLCKNFNHVPILKDISFQLAAEETIVILGPSGCGKTTLLNLISGMIQPEAGWVEMYGIRIRKPSTQVAFILQNFGLLPWKTNLQNVTLGLKIKGTPKRERNEIARKLLGELGLAGREKDYPSVLSGGEQQRVAIARAYATGPKLLLMDEPFSALDAITREKLQETLIQTWKTSPVPYLLVTHSVEEAVFLGKRILMLSGNPSCITHDIPNPGFGTPGYRQSETYYRLIRSIRKQMGEAW
jgi:NitT/TauT family transport system ATP-binding protein